MRRGLNGYSMAMTGATIALCGTESGKTELLADALKRGFVVSSDDG